MEEYVGQVIPVGRDRPQWLFVTRVDGEALYGRTWLVKPQRWSKHAYPFARAALFHLTPRSPKPQPPAAWKSLVLAAIMLAIGGSAQAQGVARQLVCPQQLSYCYYIEKPIQARPTSADTLHSITRTIDCISRENDINNANILGPQVDLGCQRHILPR